MLGLYCTTGNKLMAELLEQGRETLLRKPADLENRGLKS